MQRSLKLRLMMTVKNWKEMPWASYCCIHISISTKTGLKFFAIIEIFYYRSWSMLKESAGSCTIIIKGSAPGNGLSKSMFIYFFNLIQNLFLMFGPSFNQVPMAFHRNNLVPRENWISSSSFKIVTQICAWFNCISGVLPQFHFSSQIVN